MMLNIYMAIVYKATNKTNNKAYVGYTTRTLDERMAQHISDMKREDRSKAFHNALRKYGVDAFEWEVLLEDATLDDEIRLIAEHKTHKTAGGYNVTLGGEGCFGFTPSEETRQKMSDARKGVAKTEEHKKKIGLAHKGISREHMRKPKSEATKAKMRKPKSAEHREKIRQAKLGKPRSEETRKKIGQARKGIPAWNKGLSAKTDARVRLNIEKRLETVRANNGNPSTN